MSTIVIGAGLAGIFSARRLAQRGEDVVVVEATPHIGGRTRGNRDVLQLGQVADLGASFIDIGQDAIIQFCVDNDVPLLPQIAMFPRGPGKHFSGASILRGNMAVDGGRVSTDGRFEVAREVDDALEAQPPADVETLLAWSRRVGLSPAARQAYLSQAAFNPVSRPEFVSTWHVHPGDIGRVCWLLADGTDSIARKAAEGVDVRYSTPVRLVVGTGSRYRVMTDRGDHIADNVIVTGSVAAMRRIGFDPVLPSWKIEAILGTPMVQGGKAVAQYRGGRAIVDAAGPSTLTNSPIGLFWLKPGPDDTVVALAPVPDTGDGLLEDEPATLGHLDDQIRAMTGTQPERLGGLVQNWTVEEFFGGVVNLGTGGAARRAVLGAPVGGIHFAGEATGEWASAMEGAIRSGLRAADEVLLRRARGRSLAQPTSDQERLG